MGLPEIIKKKLNSSKVVDFSHIPVCFPKPFNLSEFVTLNKEHADFLKELPKIIQIDFIPLFEWKLKLVFLENMSSDFLSSHLLDIYHRWKKSYGFDYLKYQSASNSQICLCPFWSCKYSDSLPDFYFCFYALINVIQ